MGQYLQRLQIESVEEVGVDTELPHYTQFVDVVEVLDQNGDPYVPTPPTTTLEVAANGGANWANDNDYEIGQTVTAKTAVYTGGVEPVTYRYRWQTKDLSTDPWDTTQPWTDTTNAKNDVTFNITAGGQLRLNSQARDSADPKVQINSFTGAKTVPFPTLTLSNGDPHASGMPLVGSTLDCTTPTYTGGLAPYTVSYWWTNAADNSSVFETKYMQQTLELGPEDIGITYYCGVTISSADGQTLHVNSNSIGPTAAPTIGTLTATVDGNPYDLISPPTLTTGNSATHTLAVSYSGTSVSPNYSWEVRQGQARIAGGGASVTVTIESDPPMGVQVQCSIRDDNATDSPQSYRTLFYVSD